MKTASTVSDSASEGLSTPQSLAEALDTGFLPDNDHYRLTGEISKPQSGKTPAKKDDAASSTKDKPAAKESDAPPASEQDETASKAAASATAETQRGSRRESRWDKRERELKEARAEIARNPANRLRKHNAVKPGRKRSLPPRRNEAGKAAPKPKIDDVDPTTKQPKYKNYAEYEDAKDAWLRQETIREFNESQAKTQQLTAQQQAEREIGQSLAKKFEGPRAKYKDFDEVALSDKLTIPKGSVTEMFMLDSEHAGEGVLLLRPASGNSSGLLSRLRSENRQVHLAHHPAATVSQADGDRGGSRRLQLATLFILSSSSSSARPVTQASRPPHQVSGQGTVAKDAVEQATEDGDFETYSAAQNAKDLARLKRK